MIVGIDLGTTISFDDDGTVLVGRAAVVQEGATRARAREAAATDVVPDTRQGTLRQRGGEQATRYGSAVISRDWRQR